MAQPNVSNVDWSQYQQWEPVTLPNGTVRYIVPGTGWTYDPFVSSQTGRVQLYPNPKADLEAQRQAEEAQRQAVEDAKAANSPGRQLLNVLAPTGIALGTSVLADYLRPQSGADKLADALAQEHLAKIPGQPAPAAPNSPASAFTEAFSGGGPVPIGQNADGSLIMSDGGTSLPQSGEAIPGLLSQAPGTEAFGSEALGGFLPALGIAAGAYTGYQQFQGLRNIGDRKKLSGVEQAALALPTFGASLLYNHVPGLTRKSVKEQQAERWGNLADNNVTGAKEAFLLSQNLGDLSGKIASGENKGKEWNFEDAVMEAKKDPGQFRNVYGNFKTFGNDWATYTTQEQDEIIQRLIAENLYDPEKGDIQIKDPEQARKIKDEVIGRDPATSVLNKNQLPGTPLPVYTKNQTQTNTPSYNPLGLGKPGLRIGGVPVSTSKVQTLGQQLAARLNDRRLRV